MHAIHLETAVGWILARGPCRNGQSHKLECNVEKSQTITRHCSDRRRRRRCRVLSRIERIKTGPEKCYASGNLNRETISLKCRRRIGLAEIKKSPVEGKQSIGGDELRRVIGGTETVRCVIDCELPDGSRVSGAWIRSLSSNIRIQLGCLSRWRKTGGREVEITLSAAGRA